MICTEMPPRKREDTKIEWVVALCFRAFVAGRPREWPVCAEGVALNPVAERDFSGRDNGAAGNDFKETVH